MISISLASAATAQQLLHKKTLSECTAMGGRILTYTNTAGRGPEVGECHVPARGNAGSGAGAYAPPSAAGNAAAALGVASGVLGLIDAFQGLAGPSDSEPDTQQATGTSRADPATGSLEANSAILAERSFSRARAYNRQKNPCEAARSFALAARHFGEAGEDDRQKDSLFQSSLSEADCRDTRSAGANKPLPAKAAATTPAGDEKYVYYCPDENNVYGGGRYVKAGEGCPSGRKPQRLPQPANENGDEAYVYYCPPEQNVYDLTRKGRYVKPGEGCGDKRAQRLPRPRTEPAGDDKFAYYCPDEDNVSGGGRYVKPGEGCNGPRKSSSAKAKAPQEQLKAVLAAYRRTVAGMSEGPDKEAAKQQLQQLEQQASRQK